MYRYSVCLDAAGKQYYVCTYIHTYLQPLPHTACEDSHTLPILHALTHLRTYTTHHSQLTSPPHVWLHYIRTYVHMYTNNTPRPVLSFTDEMMPLIKGTSTKSLRPLLHIPRYTYTYAPQTLSICTIKHLGDLPQLYRKCAWEHLLTSDQSGDAFFLLQEVPGMR